METGVVSSSSSPCRSFSVFRSSSQSNSLETSASSLVRYHNIMKIPSITRRFGRSQIGKWTRSYLISQSRCRFIRRACKRRCRRHTTSSILLISNAFDSKPSVESLKKAMQTYARQGGTSTIFINDDGMQVCLPALSTVSLVFLTSTLHFSLSPPLNVPNARLSTRNMASVGSPVPSTTRVVQASSVPVALRKLVT